MTLHYKVNQNTSLFLTPKRLAVAVWTSKIKIRKQIVIKAACSKSHWILKKIR